VNREGRPDPDSLDSGASTDATQNQGDEDTASGGAPEPAEMTDPDSATDSATASANDDDITTDANGMPVDNPSG
jgi:hypothetical protein